MTNEPNNNLNSAKNDDNNDDSKNNSDSSNESQVPKLDENGNPAPEGSAVSGSAIQAESTIITMENGPAEEAPTANGLVDEKEEHSTLGPSKDFLDGPANSIDIVTQTLPDGMIKKHFI